MSVNCTHCNCNVNGKPWIIYGNTNYCSYMCAKNKPMYYRWEDIKNKEDFNYNLIPVIKKKKCIRAFSILMDSEISELSEEEYLQMAEEDNKLKRGQNIIKERINFYNKWLHGLKNTTLIVHFILVFIAFLLLLKSIGIKY